jgi:hypothetical protein
LEKTELQPSPFGKQRKQRRKEMTSPHLPRNAYLSG